MPCTTVLAGKLATNDGSTMIARTDDGFFDVKKIVVVEPKNQPKIYKSKISHVEIKLPENPMRYTASPSVDPKHGIWAATGINEANVGMTATETITSNPRVVAADPYVVYEKAKKRGEKDKIGGIGEEDIIVLVLPYIHSAREGVIRLGKLLEEYGTYEANGIAFNDENEVWWLETIGGHHWMAKKIDDDSVVVMPNQFGMDEFDYEDALKAGKNHLCSKDLLEFIKDNNLDTNNNEYQENPRLVFGSHSDQDHIYNTPRAWFMGRYLCPTRYVWDGDDADYKPESDNIPFSFVPERKLTIEDLKYMLSSHYQGTPYDPYTNINTGKRGMYRSIGINRTGVTSICQIRKGLPKEISAVEWVIFGPTTFSCAIPLYTAVSKLPKYVSDVTLDTDTSNLYWQSRLINALADPIYSSAIQIIDRYQNEVACKTREIMRRYDLEMIKSKDYSLKEKANDEIAKEVKKLSIKTLNQVLLEASKHMKNGYNRADN